MSPSDMVSIISGIALVVSAAVVAYRSLRIRGALVDRPYRARAFWTAVGSVSIVGFLVAGYADSIYGQVPTTWDGVIVEAVAWGFTFLVLYLWVAANIDVAIQADFFNRDSLSWKRGGKYATLGLIFSLYTLASLPSWWFPAGANGILNSGAGTALLSGMFILAAGYSTAVLAVTYRRIKDLRTKAYTKWVVLSVVTLFIGLFTGGTALVIIPGILWIFATNMSVSSLAIRTKKLPT